MSAFNNSRGPWSNPFDEECDRRDAYNEFLAGMDEEEREEHLARAKDDSWY